MRPFHILLSSFLTFSCLCRTFHWLTSFPFSSCHFGRKAFHFKDKRLLKRNYLKFNLKMYFREIFSKKKINLFFPKFKERQITSFPLIIKMFSMYFLCVNGQKFRSFSILIINAFLIWMLETIYVYKADLFSCLCWQNFDIKYFSSHVRVMVRLDVIPDIKRKTKNPLFAPYRWYMYRNYPKCRPNLFYTMLYIKLSETFAYLFQPALV